MMRYTSAPGEGTGQSPGFVRSRWPCAAVLAAARGRVTLRTVSGKPPENSGELTHLDDRGRARMVDVSEKPASPRTARASARVQMTAAVRQAVLAGELPKGEVLAVARVAGIQAAKETARLIPLCHPLALAAVEVGFTPIGDDGIEVWAEARTIGPTGVEMEAMTAVSVAALTIYDMCKARCRGMTITAVQLMRKDGGKSGSWRREPEPS